MEESKIRPPLQNPKTSETFPVLTGSLQGQHLPGCWLSTVVISWALANLPGSCDGVHGLVEHSPGSYVPWDPKVLQ